MKKLLVLTSILASHPIVAEEFCNKENYKEYIASTEKTDALIQKTGKGCQLTRANLTGAKYNSKTKIPLLFNPEWRGMILDNHELD